MENKAKKVRFEVARYRLSSNVKRTIKLISSAFGVLILSGFVIYEFFLDTTTKQKVDVAYYAGLNKIGLVSKEGLDNIRQNLQVITSKLKKTSEENQQLNQMVEQMIHNNKVYLIAEIGSAHLGNINLAFKAIKEAKEGGADCVKFQLYDEKTIVHPKLKTLDHE